MIENAVLYLLTNARPGGATGAILGDRVYPQELPQKPDYPAVVYQVVSGPRDYHHDGPSGLVPFRVQFDAYALTSSAAYRLRDAIIRDLSGFKGLVPTSPPTRIYGAFADNERDSAEPDLEKAGPRVKRKSVDFIIWTKEG